VSLGLNEKGAVVRSHETNAFALVFGSFLGAFGFSLSPRHQVLSVPAEFVPSCGGTTKQLKHFCCRFHGSTLHCGLFGAQLAQPWRVPKEHALVPQKSEAGAAFPLVVPTGATRALLQRTKATKIVH
jgi:hypothetical protein